MWPSWTRKIWLALLLVSWALAVGLHDYILDEDHHHDAASPEQVITQVWHTDLVPSVAVPPILIGPAILILVALLVTPAIDQEGVPQAPESRHSPPRPPNLKNLLFRGPPALALPSAKSWNLEISRAQKLYRIAKNWPSNTTREWSQLAGDRAPGWGQFLAGVWPASACPTE